jgi:hypothetical protein
MSTEAEQKIAAWEVAVTEFTELCPEWKEYDSDANPGPPEAAANAKLLFDYLIERQIPIDTGALLASFAILRKMGKLTKVPPPETEAQKAAREYEEKQAAARQKRIEEQEKARPLSHLSHVQRDAEEKAAEDESTTNAKKMWEKLDEMRKRIQNSTPPVVYWESPSPHAGKINWPATERARLAAGFNRDGSVKESK